MLANLCWSTFIWFHKLSFPYSYFFKKVDLCSPFIPILSVRMLSKYQSHHRCLIRSLEGHSSIANGSRSIWVFCVLHRLENALQEYANYLTMLFWDFLHAVKKENFFAEYLCGHILIGSFCFCISVWWKSLESVYQISFVWLSVLYSSCLSLCNVRLVLSYIPAVFLCLGCAVVHCSFQRSYFIHSFRLFLYCLFKSTTTKRRSWHSTDTV